MLKVQNLSKGFGLRTLFKDVSFTMTPGERLGLVGRNGSGKTTLIKMIIGTETPDAGAIELPKRYTVGYLSQHIQFSEETILGEACRSLETQEGGWVEEHLAEATLMGLGFATTDFERSPDVLSGGYQVRLQLAKALLERPNLLLLDEPTNYLDIVSVRWLQRFLRNWPNELIVITHDSGFMNSVTTHTMSIHRGRVRRMEGSTEKLFEIVAKEEEIHEKTRLNEEKYRRQQERFINRFRAKASKAKAVQSRIKALEKRGELDELAAEQSLDFKFNPAPFSGSYLAQAEGLSFGYTPEKILLEGVDVEIAKGECIGVIGKNGKGKTTFLNLLAGELQPLAGAVKRSPNLRLAHFGQNNIDRLNPGMTVEDEILSVHPEHDRRLSRGICGVMLFEGDDAEKKVDVLSGGERARVLLGKLLVSPANLLLLDEPTNHLDMDSIDSLIEAVAVFPGASIIVTHNERVLSALATRLIIFDRGRTHVFEGTYQNFLDQIGWSDEDEDRGKRRTKAKSVSRKDTRRQRAEIVAARSKALKPLKRRMEKQEEAIVTLEARAKQINEDLLEASNAGDAGAITKLSQEAHDVQSRIEQHFEKLEELTIEHDWRSLEFDRDLDKLDG